MSEADKDSPKEPKRLLSFLFVSLPQLIIGTLILVGIGINFANVVGRYVFKNAIFWAEEIMVFIVIWCVFIGSIAITFNGAHLRMDLLSSRLSSPWKKIINGFVAVVFIAGGIFVVVQSYKVVSLMNRLGQVSVTAGLPVTIPHMALLVGFALMVLAVIVRLRSYFTGKF